LSPTRKEALFGLALDNQRPSDPQFWMPCAKAILPFATARPKQPVDPFDPSDDQWRFSPDPFYRDGWT